MVYDTQSIENLINILGNVRERPKVWIGEHPFAIVAFLEGFNVALRSIGLETSPDDAYYAILLKRGWRNSPAGLWDDLTSYLTPNENQEKRQVARHHLSQEHGQASQNRAEKSSNHDGLCGQ